jgi:hypothetical protein
MFTSSPLAKRFGHAWVCSLTVRDNEACLKSPKMKKDLEHQSLPVFGRHVEFLCSMLEEKDEDDETCRRRFITNYENWCTHSLRPRLSNYLAVSRLESRASNRLQRHSVLIASRRASTKLTLCPCVPRELFQN